MAADESMLLSALKLIADETRWRIMQTLRASDRQVSEIVAETGLPQNLVSYHLGVMRQAGLVQQHRSDADARASYYSLHLSQLQAIYQQIGADLLLPQSCTTAQLPAMTVLFLCRANSARSQMAEGWLRHLSAGRMIVRSAGTHPAPIQPHAIQVMAEVGIDIGYQQPKALDQVGELQPDVVVTVCDIAREECPLWPEVGRSLHWSIPDPVAAAPGEAQLAAFRHARDDLHQRITSLLLLLTQN
ncbi:protein tyrosine phosphatase [Oscillochloris trichoides DG-6]|uniref:Protein tyrosine phosphatase n=1 Tax=Oscillochloris trichoides DG-6 TaxID=765420 RepID=E1IAS5_9CHLR|nr:metalloregulator ArsR/SmtB family transcription factor [Oscillochloris trichoides]EFO81681.1 protein tyrosine phosphatase [Oscillochloris trichoides DG-6]